MSTAKRQRHLPTSPVTQTQMDNQKDERTTFKECITGPALRFLERIQNKLLRINSQFVENGTWNTADEDTP